jgi:hypothetical protein
MLIKNPSCPGIYKKTKSKVEKEECAQTPHLVKKEGRKLIYKKNSRLSAYLIENDILGI